MGVIERNNVQVVGEGPETLVFSHGYGCDQGMWRYLTGRLKSHYRIILLDLVGCGKSDLSAYDRDKYDTLRGYVDDLIEILDELAYGPVIFVGHSVSASIGMLAAIEAPERFAAQIMIGPSPSLINDGDYIGGFERADIDGLLQTLDSNYLGWASSMAPAIMGAQAQAQAQPELGKELLDSFCRNDPEIAKYFARVAFLSDLRADLVRVTTPTLIVQSSGDPLVPVAVGEYMHKMIRDSTLAIVQNTGHCPHLSAPDASVEAIEAFLKTHSRVADGQSRESAAEFRRDI